LGRLKKEWECFISKWRRETKIMQEKKHSWLRGEEKGSGGSSRIKRDTNRKRRKKERQALHKAPANRLNRGEAIS